MENKFGKLGEILSLPGMENIRIIAATIADTSEFGILRILVNNPDKAYRVLKNNSVEASMTDVIAISVDRSAETLASTLNHFSRSGLSIEYMYSFPVKEKSIIVIRTSNRETALETAVRHNLDCISRSDLETL
jgi:hypothetical protein